MPPAATARKAGHQIHRDDRHGDAGVTREEKRCTENSAFGRAGPRLRPGGDTASQAQDAAGKHGLARHICDARRLRSGQDPPRVRHRRRPRGRRAAMIRMKIVEERRPVRSGTGWSELRGKKGDLDVAIRLKSQSAASTRVEVTARRVSRRMIREWRSRCSTRWSGARTRLPAARFPGTRRTRWRPHRRARSGRA